MMEDYNCHFLVVIRTKSENGIDLEEKRMNEMTQDIGELLVEKYPDIGVYSVGFEVVK